MCHVCTDNHGSVLGLVHISLERRLWDVIGASGFDVEFQGDVCSETSIFQLCHVIESDADSTHSKLSVKESLHCGVIFLSGRLFALAERGT